MAQKHVTKLTIHGQQYEVEEVPILKMDEKISTYELADGTTLTVRTVVTNIYRAIGQHNEQGEPIYVVRSNSIPSLAGVPDSLREE